MLYFNLLVMLLMQKLFGKRWVFFNGLTEIWLFERPGYSD